MAVSESSRLSASLKKESVPVKRLIVNQLLPPSSSDCKFCSIKRKVYTQTQTQASHELIVSLNQRPVLPTPQTTMCFCSCFVLWYEHASKT